LLLLKSCKRKIYLKSIPIILLGSGVTLGLKNQILHLDLWSS